MAKLHHLFLRWGLDNRTVETTGISVDPDIIARPHATCGSRMIRNLSPTGWRRLFGRRGNHGYRLAATIVGTFALNLLAKALMLGVTILLAHFVGAHDYGLYASALAAVTLVGVPASLGLPNLIVREMAALHLRSEWGLMRGLLSRSGQLQLIVWVVLGITLYLKQDRLVTNGGYGHALLWISFALLPFTQLTAICNTTLRGLHHVVLGLVPELLVVPGLFIASVTVLHALAPATLTPAVVMILRLSSVATGATIGIAAVWQKLPCQVFSAAPVYRTGTWLHAALPMLWVGAMSIITTQTDVVMLAAIKGATEAGIYQVAARGATLVAFTSTVCSIALQPTISRLYTNGELTHLRRIIKRVGRVMTTAALAVASCYFAFGSTLLRIIFGPAFEPAAHALIVLAAGWVIVAAFGPARDTLLMSGGERYSAITISFAATLNILLNLTLIPTHGVTGAAAATAISLIACHLGYALFVRHKIGFWPGLGDA